MADWPLASGFRAESFGAGARVPGGTTVTSSATAHTKGSWVQLDAATGFDASLLILDIAVQFQDTLYLIDIGIGASGSEQVLIPNLLVSQSTMVIPRLVLPIAIPAGSRISARSQDNFGSSVSFISGMLLAGGFVNPASFNTITAYGPNIATSNGVTADAGATANTKGSWAQITASTTRDMRGLILSGIRAVPGTAMAADYANLVDIGVGASGSEQVLIPNIVFQASITTGGASGSPLVLSGLGTLFPRFIPPIPCDIPAGSRLAVRQQSTTTNATDRTSAYAIYGLG